jgi:glycosyl transferase family 25
MTWTSYLINLEKNEKRLKNSSAQFDAQNITYVRIDAVNGWALSVDEIAEVYDAAENETRGKHPLVPAEIGCYLSHIAAWQQIADGQEEGGFIFEDDFLANENLAEILSLLSTPDASWDMIKLFSFDQDPKIVHDQPLGSKFRVVAPYRVPTCLIGYGLTKDAAKQLVARAVPFFRPVDEDQKWFWETGLRVDLVLPSPISVGDQETATGTIGRARKLATQSGLRNLWRKSRYQMMYRSQLKYHRSRQDR